ncbi:hypothetical protein F9C07_2280746 [Aspergillus flavus]|uniref:RNase III domain-containing protein n=1 Tax=Aspergillus flavus (strain ATCC 200026 / FGSC A1120 / IAM 13836 / NRRL 3357 / JCM 12722 / SRRC 167) TaxID=332952 RepID=A0A7U2MX56_ASPFN|nr:uncharacterized protein G4B84_010620 [Aspergillus flavus NRRL3357]KAF7624069.1 hypothetical protein AFLA_007786 [Aspergillus flavus NRRL3357]QMW35129.1 hypothetical protein G4B84_010620 [Aspergillus flavus NRRL3357]QRD91507.1 hypothetical protein F9C07_2280746 [Aspergillus flavus]
MDINTSIDQVAHILGYQNEPQIHLYDALIAPRADREWLGDLGIDLIRLCLSFHAYQTRIPPGDIAAGKEKLCTYAHLVSVAQRTAIDRMIPYNSPPGEERHITVGRTMAAIIAAAHLDCGGSHRRTWQILENIGFFTQEDNGVDPTRLQASINMDTHLPILLSGEPDRRAETTDLLPDTAQVSKPQRSMDISFEKSGENQPKPMRGRHQMHNPIVSFLEEETMKCQARSIRTPREWYFSAEIEIAIQEAGLKQYDDLLKRLILASGSSLSVLVLKEAMQTWRSRTDQLHLQISTHSSKADTYTNICLIDQTITGLNLFRRYHISYLFKACGGCEIPSLSGFVTTPAYNASAIKRAGNPLKIAESKLTTAMMKQVLPGLEPGSPEYKKGYNHVRNLRLLARRFHILQERFGNGILALIPYPQHFHHPGLELTDNMLSKVPESVFRDIVSILDHSQGRYLRALGEAAGKVIKMMLYEPQEFCPPLQLEMIDNSYILQQPKDLQTILPLLN